MKYKYISIVVLFCIVSLYSLAGFTDIDPGQVGLLIKKIGSNRGMQKETLDTGLHWIEPISYDVDVYDTRLKQYSFKIKDQGISSTTKDGQPIVVDMSVELGLLDKNVPFLHENVGRNYFDQVVYPSVRSILRNTTSTQLSENIYTGEGRLAIQQAMTKKLTDKLSPMGIRIAVNLRAITFSNTDFVAILEEKAKAQQRVEIEKRKAAAAKNTAIKVANIAEGQKQKRIKEAEAGKEEKRLEGIGRRLQKEQDAKGILAIAKAEAEGVRLRREALSGAGGKELVSIEWAKNLGPNVKVYAFPTGSPGTTSLMDLNGIMQGALRLPK